MQGEPHWIGKRVDQFLDPMAEADTSILVVTYENEMSVPQEQEIAISGKTGNGRPLYTFDEIFRTNFDFLRIPHRLRSSDRMGVKRMVLRLAFAEKLPYERNAGLESPKLRSPLGF